MRCHQCHKVIASTEAYATIKRQGEKIRFCVGKGCVTRFQQQNRVKKE